MEKTLFNKYKVVKHSMLSPHCPSTVVTFHNGMPKIFITKEARRTMEAIVNLSPQEVSWFGTVEVQGTEYLIDKIFLFDQEVNHSTTISEPEFITKGFMEILDTHGMETVNKIRFWGHSHVDGGTSPSSQDNLQMKEFKDNGCEFFIRGILNRKGRMELSLYLYKLGISLCDVEWSIAEEQEEDYTLKIKEELDKKVREKKYEIVQYQIPQHIGSLANNQITKYDWPKDWESLYK